MLYIYIYIYIIRYAITVLEDSFYYGTKYLEKYCKKFQTFIIFTSLQKERKQDITPINPKSTIYHIINWLSFSPLAVVSYTLKAHLPHGLIVILYPFQIVNSVQS